MMKMNKKKPQKKYSRSNHKDFYDDEPIVERSIFEEDEFYPKSPKKEKLTPEEMRARELGRHYKRREIVFQQLRILQNCLIRDGKKLRAIH